MFVRALATRNFAKAADLSLMLTASLPNNLDVDQVKEDLVRALRSWATRTLVKQLPYHDKSMDNVTIQIVRILVGCRCTMEWGWLRIHRALTTLDTSLVYLYRDVNYTRMLQQYFERAEQRKLRAMMKADLPLRAISSFETQLNIQERLNEYTMFQAELVRRHAQVFRGSISKISAIMRAFVQLVWAAVIVAGAAGLVVFIDQHGGLTALDWMGPQLAGWVRRMPALDDGTWLILVLAYAYFLVTLVKLRKRLGYRDAGAHEKVAAV
jgi:hypothetical protein